MFQDITIEEWLEKQQKHEFTLIDVRSPSEYNDSTMPGSLNIPLFDDQERAEIGTLYKQVSVQAAKDRGLEIVSAKLPAFVKSFEQIQGQKMVFCWRGGMRSKTTATVLSLMGIRVYRLTGGVRAYRKWVVDTLDRIQYRPKTFVLNGFTGSGKTAILKLLKEKGYPVLDLEGMANHRGSIFGEIGLRAHNQKTFDSLLLKEIMSLMDTPFVLIEAESKRVGKIVLPEFISDNKEKGIQLFLDMPISERVRHIIEEYHPTEHKAECLQAFRFIKSRIHTPVALEIETHLKADRFEEAVQLMLEHYYDPRYEHTTSAYNTDPVMIKAQNMGEAVEAITAYLEQINSNVLV